MPNWHSQIASARRQEQGLTDGNHIEDEDNEAKDTAAGAVLPRISLDFVLGRRGREREQTCLEEQSGEHL